MMIRMFIRHNVSDYSAWRHEYDAFDQERQGLGVTAHAVYQAAGNPNDVTVTHDFENLGAAQAFASGARLKEVMGQAGVAGTPQVWFASPA